MNATNKLNPKAVSLSLAAVSAVLSLLCALLIAVAPQAALKFFGSIFHGIDITKIAASVSVSGVATGLIAVILIGAVTGWLFAAAYNYILKIVR